jgi:hypothetical protein
MSPEFTKTELGREYSISMPWSREIFQFAFQLLLLHAAIYYLGCRPHDRILPRFDTIGYKQSGTGQEMGEYGCNSTRK